jgi:hypothetical protein
MAEYKYKTYVANDLDWSEEVIDKLASKFDDDDFIEQYEIKSERDVGDNSESYKVYYIKFETKDYDGYQLKLNYGYTQWKLTNNSDFLGEYYSGLESDSDNNDDVYTVSIDIQDLYEWVIEQVKEREGKAEITEKVDNLVEIVEESAPQDKVKIIKYLMKKLNVSVEDLE